MSTPKTPAPGRLFLSLLFGGEPAPKGSPAATAALAALQAAYGPMDVCSELLPFTYTSYYEREMGAPLWRRLICFERLMARDALVEAKYLCLDLERQFTDAQGHRAVNLDPGLLTVENLILATCKNFTHRVYLARGVFADLTLMYHNKRFQTLPWTFPDYASPELQAILMTMRERYLEALKQSGPAR